MNHEPAFKRPGSRVRYNYTDGPVPAGTLGTVLGFLGRSQQAQIRWDDETVSVHTPDEFDVVPRGTRRVAQRNRHTANEARRQWSRRYTDEQVREMLKNAAMWLEPLRDAAKERGMEISSVTPIGKVLTFLRGDPMVSEARRSKRTFEDYASEVERALITSGVRHGEASVWISNHGSFIDQEFKSGT